MQKTVYEDYKYAMQDLSNLYIGAKYTMDEILEEESISFKFRMVTERYILPESDREDTLETHLYYLDPKSFIVKIYKQLKAKVKVSVIEEKKSADGSVKKSYCTRVMTPEELSAVPVAEKELKGMVIQELSINKLALMMF